MKTFAPGGISRVRASITLSTISAEHRRHASIKSGSRAKAPEQQAPKQTVCRLHQRILDGNAAFAGRAPPPQHQVAEQGNQLKPAQPLPAAHAVGRNGDHALPAGNAQNADIQKAACCNSEQKHRAVCKCLSEVHETRPFKVLPLAIAVNPTSRPSMLQCLCLHCM
jgi:hypothetical protein